MKKTLQLSPHYEVMCFIDFKNALKKLVKGKVDIIASWDEDIFIGNEKVKFPSIVRLKEMSKRNYYNNHSTFSRQIMVKRDKSTCMYCGKKLTNSQITVDHVLPRAQGGITSYMNCVVACQPCNGKKANFTPEQAGMVLLKKPHHPSYVPSNSFIDNSDYNNAWHPEWDDFLMIKS